MILTKYIESLNTDCLGHMKKCKDNQYDWAICDPNYGIGKSVTSKKNDKVLQKSGKYLSLSNPDYHQKEWDFEKPHMDYFYEIKRISKKQIIFGANYFDNLSGGRLVWDKLNGTNDQYGCEIAYLSFTQRTDIVYYLWSGMMQGIKASKDIRIAIRQRGNKKNNEKRIHQTQKPVALYQFILKEYEIDSTQSVFDSHSGSLSLAVACHINKISFTGTELDIDHYNDSKKRINNLFNNELF